VERQPQFARGESGKQMVVDRSLVARVEVVLAGVREIGLRAVEIPPMPPFVG